MRAWSQAVTELNHCGKAAAVYLADELFVYPDLCAVPEVVQAELGACKGIAIIQVEIYVALFFECFVALPKRNASEIQSGLLVGNQGLVGGKGFRGSWRSS